jgi:hypothetical protein
VCGAYNTILKRIFTKNDDEKIIKEKEHKKKMERKDMEIKKAKKKVK